MSLLAYPHEIGEIQSRFPITPCKPQQQRTNSIILKPTLSVTSSEHGRFSLLLPIEFNHADIDEPVYVVEETINKLIAFMHGIKDNYHGDTV
jgi:hypothetical protein